MSKVRRTFTPEFKIEAANLVLQQGYTMTQACQSLAIGETALRRWIAQLRQEQQGLTPQAKALTPEQRKIQELEARIVQLELEKSLLKKATALLISDENKLTRW